MSSFDLAHGFAQVGAIHLIGAAIAELGRGIGSLAKRAVEAGSELGGIRKDGSVGQLGLVERFADSGYAAVHHVGRGDDVDPGAGQRN